MDCRKQLEIEPLAHLDYPATGIDPGLHHTAAPAPEPLETAVINMSAEEGFSFQQMAASTLEPVQITTTTSVAGEIPGLPQGAVVLDAANPEALPTLDASAPDGYYQIPAFREYQETGNFFTDMANLPYNKVCRALNTAVDIVNMPIHDVQYIGEHGWRAYGEAALEANIDGFKQFGYSLMDKVQSGMDFLREAPKQAMDSFVFKAPGEILTDTYTYCKESLTSVEAWDQAIEMALGAMAFKKVGGPAIANELGVIDDVVAGAGPKTTVNPIPSEEPYFNPIGTAGAARTWTKAARIKHAQLPNTGKVRYVPPKNWHSSEPLPRGANSGYIDKFGNEWTRSPSRTQGQAFEWDVQLGKNATPGMKSLSPDGRHVNISLDGRVTH